MQDLNDKVTGGTLTAPEWNEVPSEIQNVIEGLGITLSSGDLNQLGKAIAGYVANGTFYLDSGSANTYVLATVGSKQNAPAYTTGFHIQFIAGNTNTSASTVNVGGLGVKSIKSEVGVLGANNIIAGDLVEAFFDGTDFILIDVDSVKALPFTGGGVLRAGGRNNQIRDTDSYFMPAADSVKADTVLIAELPDTFNAQTPDITRDGTDLLRDRNGTDTVVEFIGAAKIEFTSNGVDEWSL